MWDRRLDGQDWILFDGVSRRFTSRSRIGMHGHLRQLPDTDPVETEEWIDSLDAVVDATGERRAQFLLSRLSERAGQRDVGMPVATSTPYVNSIPTTAEPP